MGTRSQIAIQLPDGKIRSIYCHWDGYPEGVGKTLVQHYTSDARAAALIALGSLSSLHERLEPEVAALHSFGNPIQGVTIAYGRDRGETDVDATDWENRDRWLDHAKRSDAEFAYLRVDSVWYGYALRHGVASLVPLDFSVGAG